ncbi:MAG: 2-C-methyl-D-erythritol 4-phosphate cytidylyltransferase [Lautropia sp.]|nr:2-C-methyl-D-erythritol 4-phosphate cytidylyltransferase [Lautropia sp.]
MMANDQIRRGNPTYFEPVPRAPVESGPEALPPGRHFVLIPAAGSGSRFGAKVPKQYLELGGGRTVLEATVSAFLAESWITRVAVVVQADDPLAMRLPGLRNPRVLLIRRGGGTRRDTVLNGLTAMAQRGMIEPHDWVHVHDAARPGIDSGSLQRLARVLESEPCGALLCVPVTDTVKRIDTRVSVAASGEYRSGGTVDRSRLWLAQTPQVFRFAALRRALEAHPNVTDEAGAIEAEGGRPRMISGTRRNLKITTPEDLIMLRILMNQQPQGEHA